MGKHTRKTPRQARKKSGNIHFQKTEKNMASKAGLIPVINLLDKLDFTQVFRRVVHHERKDNALITLKTAFSHSDRVDLSRIQHQQMYIALVRLPCITKGYRMVTSIGRNNIGPFVQESQCMPHQRNGDAGT